LFLSNLAVSSYEGPLLKSSVLTCTSFSQCPTCSVGDRTNIVSYFAFIIFYGDDILPNSSASHSCVAAGIRFTCSD